MRKFKIRYSVSEKVQYAIGRPNSFFEPEYLEVTNDRLIELFKAGLVERAADKDFRFSAEGQRQIDNGANWQLVSGN